MPSPAPAPRVAALLAAGGGSRFAGPQHKLLADLNGAPVWQRSLANVLAAGFQHVLVVTGAVELDLPPAVIRCHNPEWASGQASSVQLAVAAAAQLGATALTIGLADQPFVPADAWRAVAEAPSECRIVVSVYDDAPGPNPVRLAADVWPLLPVTGDAGARDLIRDHPAWVCRVHSVGSAADIDTLEDLARWRSC
ncbi:MAG: nucleotidyltransferase family protein [Actinomycetota bacterium]|nr:nucleotidyltransferase family protein [Actinomycetota bacterium]